MLIDLLLVFKWILWYWWIISILVHDVWHLFKFCLEFFLQFQVIIGVDECLKLQLLLNFVLVFGQTLLDHSFILILKHFNFRLDKSISCCNCSLMINMVLQYFLNLRWKPLSLDIIDDGNTAIPFKVILFTIQVLFTKLKCFLFSFLLGPNSGLFGGDGFQLFLEGNLLGFLKSSSFCSGRLFKSSLFSFSFFFSFFDLLFKKKSLFFLFLFLLLLLF